MTHPEYGIQSSLQVVQVMQYTLGHQGGFLAVLLGCLQMHTAAGDAFLILLPAKQEKLYLQTSCLLLLMTLPHTFLTEKDL